MNNRLLGKIWGELKFYIIISPEWWIKLRKDESYIKNTSMRN